MPPLTAQVTIDTRGQRCPLPLLQAKKALKELVEGDVLCVEATDPSAKGDFDAMLKHLPHQLLEYQRQVCAEGSYPWVDSFYIRKGI